MGERRGALGALPARHTLRPPRRAGGVEQQRQILGPRLRRNAARGAGQFLEAAGASFRAAIRDARQPARRNRAADRGSGRLVEHDCTGVGIPQAIIQLFSFDAPIERGHDDPDELTRPVERSHLQPVLQDYRQAVSAAKAEGGQPAPHAADLTIPRRVAESPLPVDDRQRVGTALDHGEKGAAQIKHGPGLDEYWGAAFVAAAQKPSQEEVFPTLSALYLAPPRVSKFLVRQRVVASAAS